MSKFVDYAYMSFDSLLHRKLRSWLTIIGIFIGIAAVVALVALAQGLTATINDQFQKLGANRIVIQPEGTILGPLGAQLSAAKLTTKDLDVVRKVSGIDYAVGPLFDTGKVTFKDETKFVNVVSIENDIQSTKFIERAGLFKIAQGSMFDPSDKFNAIVGSGFAVDFFNHPVNINDRIKINGVVFVVKGIYQKTGTPTDNSISIPIDTGRTLFGESSDAISFISSTAKSGLVPSDVADDVEKELRISRNVKKEEEDFTVQTSEQLIKTFLSVLDIVEVVLIGIAAISLIVGGIGIMNTMYTAIVERTDEIGVMKAIGAKNSDVFVIFLIESGLLGLAGGIIGVLSGVGLAKLIEYIAARALGSTLLRASFPWYLIVGALLFSFLVGCASGTSPAMQASRMKPVEALRFQ